MSETPILSPDGATYPPAFGADLAELATRVRAYRRRYKLTRRAFAEILDVSAACITDLEAAKHRPNPALLARLERLLTPRSARLRDELT